MNKKRSFMMATAIMSIHFLTMGAAAIAPALASIAVAFPAVSLTTIYMIPTLPSFLAIPATVIVGIMAGKSAKYKTLCIIGCILFVIAGVAPAFANNITVILIERAAFGFGLGLIAPLRNSLIIRLYEGDKRANMFGISAVVANIGGIFLQFLGGLLADITWNYTFYSYTLGILSLLLVIFFLPEPAKVEQPENTNKPKVKIRGAIWLISILFGIASLLIFPVCTLMSDFLVFTGLGGPIVAGTVLSFFTVGGIIGGAIFGPIYKLVKKYIIALGCLLPAVGYALVIFTGNLILITIGTCIIGAGLSIIVAGTFMIVGMACDPDEVSVSVSIMMALTNVAIFLSTYWISLVGAITKNMLVMPMVINMALFAIGVVIFLFVDPLSKYNAVQNE